jgi:hypothetical protein
MLKKKGTEWLKRYLPAEIIATVAAIVAASIAHFFSNNHILIAYTGSFGEAIGFYSTVAIQNILEVVNKNKAEHKRFSISDSLKIVVDMLLEFGVAGMIDGLLLRPLFMYLFTLYLSSFTLGILLGKIAGDITFYMLVISSYEIKKRIKKSI